MRPNLVISVAAGPEYEELAAINRPRWLYYANRCNADLIVLTGRTADFGVLEKFRVEPYVRQYKRTLFVDADCFIKPTCPNLFDLVPQSDVGMHDDWDYLKHTKWLRDERTVALASQGVKYETDACWNSGVVVCSARHADIWQPPTKPLPGRHCDEQFWVEYQSRLWHKYSLPTDYNAQWWMTEFGRLRQRAEIVHYANAEHRRRVSMLKMERDLLPPLPITILATPRTGSNLLQLSLARHRQAVNGGEWCNMIEGENELDVWKRKQNGVACNLVKVMPQHFSSPRYLECFRREAVRVYLYREDRDAQLHSWERASKSGNWIAGQRYPVQSEWNRARAVGLIEQAESMYRPVADVMLSYERLIGDWDASVLEILTMACWDSLPISMATMKQSA